MALPAHLARYDRLLDALVSVVLAEVDAEFANLGSMDTTQKNAREPTKAARAFRSHRLGDCTEE